MDTVDKILDLIKQKGVTKQQFLKEVGFDKSAIGDWKRGTTQSYMKHIDKIADYFNVSVDYLLGRDEIEETEEQRQLKLHIICFNELSSDDKAKVVEYAQMLRDRSKR